MSDPVLLHPSVIAPLPTTEGGFACIVADPPWSFRSWAPTRNPNVDRSVERHYGTMTNDQVAEMPVCDVAAADAHLFLWTTGPKLPMAFDVMRAWGFRYSGMGFVWIKLTRKSGDAQYQLRTLAEWSRLLHMGLGFTTRKNAEFCLLGRRGRARRLAANIHEVIIAPVREHSRKPDEAFERMERYCSGPRLDLFARESRPGWSSWGNESTKFDEGAG
jgi:N6-adenosine-specific RNA methylase IME4